MLGLISRRSAHNNYSLPNLSMSDSASIQTQTVKVTNGDLQISAFLAIPAITPAPAVIVFQEIFGVNSHIRDICQRLAKAGYVAIAPAIYQRQVSDFETGYAPEDVVRGREYKALTTAAELISDTQATIAYLRQLPAVATGGIGCIGFCFGGHVAYLAATLNDIQATASFYGAGITTMTPGGGAPSVTCTPHIKGTLYGFFGDLDQSIPQTQVDEIEAALTQAGVNHQIWRYPGADHGFFCDQRASYQPEAAADAWQRVLKLFQEQLPS
jgi:carboxymethylenebutenolidase